MIGASNNEDTTFVYVEWEVNGGSNIVHGWPITKDDLVDLKGANL